MLPSKQTHDAVQLRFRIHEVDPLGGDPQPSGGTTQPMLDERTPHPLALATVFDKNERRVDADVVRAGFHDLDVADLVHGARSGRPRVGAWMLELTHADLEQPPVVVDDRRGGQRVGLIGLQRNPVRRVVGEELEPLMEPAVVEQPGLAIEKRLDLGP